MIWDETRRADLKTSLGRNAALAQNDDCGESLEQREQGKQDPCQAAGKIDPVIIQPGQAALEGGGRSAAMFGVAFGLLLAGRTKVDGLNRRAEETVRERTSQPAKRDPERQRKSV